MHGMNKNGSLLRAAVFYFGSLRDDSRDTATGLVGRLFGLLNSHAGNIKRVAFMLPFRRCATIFTAACTGTDSQKALQAD
jgi:hypothetical protein